ncbi:hypothetical protein AALO_G00206360 [Alosa alosa]|uniref:Cytochrome P450 n=1 Tax=Alosa alosa TaxID=278164 RepID=A0AAV6G7F9_9TELE|nr:hypothetical protein AALO_G00206360 [Alosa alosa]
MVEDFKQDGTVNWESDRSKILVKTPTSWSAQTFSTRPQMPSGPAAFGGLTARSVRLTSCSSTVRMKSAPFDPTFFLSRAVSNVICSLVFGRSFSYDDVDFLRLLQIISDTVCVGSSPWGPEKDIPNTEFHYDNLAATVFNLFLAGTETTSTIRFAFMILIKHPDIQERVQKEIDSVLGQHGVPRMEDRKSLPFTDAVIHEVQRYMDLVPLNLPHLAIKDISFKGYTIPKDTVIIPMLHSVLRDEDQWEKPWTFNPDHFLDKNGNFKKNPAFLPFSAGKRVCAGESLARMELLIFLVSIVQQFHLSPLEDHTALTSAQNSAASPTCLTNTSSLSPPADQQWYCSP